jgi:hypothetical protein
MTEVKGMSRKMANVVTKDKKLITTGNEALNKNNITSSTNKVKTPKENMDHLFAVEWSPEYNTLDELKTWLNKRGKRTNMSADTDGFYRCALSGKTDIQSYGHLDGIKNHPNKTNHLPKKDILDGKPSARTYAFYRDTTDKKTVVFVAKFCKLK